MLAAKSSVHSWSFNSHCLWIPRDNLESLFSYVEEAERKCGWRLQICELRLYPPFPLHPQSISEPYWCKVQDRLFKRTEGLDKSKNQKNLTQVEFCLTWPQCSTGIVFSSRRSQQKGFLTSPCWAHPFVCYLNPGFGEIQSWLGNKSIGEDKEHLGNGFSLPV